MSGNIAVVQVFILAENRLLREALARILNKKSDIRVVGASAFVPDIVHQITVAGPHVLLCDSATVALSELRLVSEVRGAMPGLKVVMVGMEAEPGTFLKAVRDGIAGYVLKEASAMEVAACVRAVANGEAICPPILCMTLFEQLANPTFQATTFVFKNDLGLTRREQQLVQMISRGLTNKEIAAQLSLSEQTVKNHVHRVLRKLGATDRLSAVELCRRPGVVA